MSPRRLRLEGPHLGELIKLARARYGAGMRIVGAEKVSVGGIWSLGAREHYELLIELEEPDQPVMARVPTVGGSPAGPTGLAALIEAAEATEADVRQAGQAWQPSTSTHGFAELLESLTRQNELVDADNLVVLNPESLDEEDGADRGADSDGP